MTPTWGVTSTSPMTSMGAGKYYQPSRPGSPVLCKPKNFFKKTIDNSANLCYTVYRKKKKGTETNGKV